MKPVVKFATVAICILGLHASNASAQLPAGHTGLTAENLPLDLNDIWIVDTGAGLTAENLLLDLNDIWIVDTGGGLTVENPPLDLNDIWVVDTGDGLTVEELLLLNLMIAD